MSRETVVPPTHERIADAAAVMEQIREGFRLRRGQSVGERTDYHRHMDGVNLKQIQYLANLADVPIPQSHRKKVGRIIMLGRRVLWKLLTPVLRQQADYNKTNAALVSSLMQDRALLIQENRELRERLEALEAHLAPRGND